MIVGTSDGDNNVLLRGTALSIGDGESEGFDALLALSEGVNGGIVDGVLPRDGSEAIKRRLRGLNICGVVVRDGSVEGAESIGWGTGDNDGE